MEKMKENVYVYKDITTPAKGIVIAVTLLAILATVLENKIVLNVSKVLKENIIMDHVLVRMDISKNQDKMNVSNVIQNV